MNEKQMDYYLLLHIDVVLNYLEFSKHFKFVTKKRLKT